MPESAGPRPSEGIVARRLEDLRAMLPSLADLPSAKDGEADGVILRLADALESLQRRWIRARTQLRALEEMIEAFVPGRDPTAVVESLAVYLCHVFSVAGVLCLRRANADEEWRGVEAQPGQSIRPLRFPQDLFGDVSAGAPAGARAALRLESYDCVETFSIPGHEGGPEALVAIVALRGSECPDADQLEPRELARQCLGILETLRHREAIETSDRFRHQLLEAMRDGLLVVDRESRIVEVNGAAAGFLARTRAELIGSPLMALTEAAPAMTRHLLDAVAEGIAPPAREFSIAIDRSRMPMNVAASPIEDDSGRFRGLVINLTDLTSVRAMEEEIGRLDRLAALGRFAAGVAHEIRNPLAGIEAGVGYLARRFAADAPEQDDVRFVASEVRRLNGIVTDLLDYTRPRALDLGRLSVAQLVERTRQVLAPLAERRAVRVELEGATSATVEADAERLEQVLLNLLKNAIEATPSGGCVRLRWDRDQDGVCSLRVEDEGGGMSAEQRARAFEPFFTTKGNGTGLGLSLSLSIVQQHGGRLSLLDREPHGLVAVVELPPDPTERIAAHAVFHSDRR